MTVNNTTTKGNTMTVSHSEVWEVVAAHMLYSGEDRWRLTDSQYITAYLLADGFGKIDQKFAGEQCWDWSHVRDSSPAGLVAVWEYICDLHNNGKLRIASDVATP